MIKRETGANPVQSRCCKLHFQLAVNCVNSLIGINVLNNTIATETGFREGVQLREQVRRPAKHYSISEAFEEKATKHQQEIIIYFLHCSVLFPGAI
ncbi:MAG: hypothetical protein H6Q14_2902 [Bacteroidetes bacterium]|jgi:hypothetical protein|nr:hypothetical protein [Bacteroidota bacterium]